MFNDKMLKLNNRFLKSVVFFIIFSISIYPSIIFAETKLFFFNESQNYLNMYSRFSDNYKNKLILINEKHELECKELLSLIDKSINLITEKIILLDTIIKKNNISNNDDMINYIKNSNDDLVGNFVNAHKIIIRSLLRGGYYIQNASLGNCPNRTGIKAQKFDKFTVNELQRFTQFYRPEIKLPSVGKILSSCQLIDQNGPILSYDCVALIRDSIN